MIKKHFTDSEQVALRALFELNDHLSRGTICGFRGFPHWFVFRTYTDILTGKLLERKGRDDIGPFRDAARVVMFVNTKGRNPFMVSMTMVLYPHAPTWETMAITVGPLLRIQKGWALSAVETFLPPDYRERKLNKYPVPRKLERFLDFLATD